MLLWYFRHVCEIIQFSLPKSRQAHKTLGRKFPSMVPKGEDTFIYEQQSLRVNIALPL